MDPQDHRVIANRLELFHQQEEGPGMIFWHPRGLVVYQLIENSIRKRMKQAGFKEVRTPQILARSLWEASGHWQKFGANMFSLEDGDRAFALKRMSYPGHIQIFNKRGRTFRDLPLRFSEFGACHRNEPSGALQGLVRTRAFVQDDAHIFCREEHIDQEVAASCALLKSVYADFGFTGFTVGFSTRPSERAGSDAIWDKAEAALAGAARAAGLDCKPQPGEGAFYGPKLDFFLRDRRDREWQCGTVQLDLVLPGRLGARYVDSDGARRQPVLIHQAVLGSIERFLGILLEHYEGNLPLWLAPDQVVVATIGKTEASYTDRVAATLAEEDLRVVTDARAERLSCKIVDARKAGIPILLAVGGREARDGTVSLRRRDGTQETLDLRSALKTLAAEAAQ